LRRSGAFNSATAFRPQWRLGGCGRTAGSACGERPAPAPRSTAKRRWRAEHGRRTRLVEERKRLHNLPALPHTICFGQTRRVSWQSTISVGGAIYSVPSRLVDERVWARVDGSELVVVYADGADGPREVARHALTTPGRPSIYDEHYPPKPAGALERKPRAATAEERAFLQVGPGAEKWLKSAAAAGTTKLRRKLAEAIALAKLHGPEAVDEALAVAAEAGRFGDGDLAAILAHHEGARVIAFPARAAEERSLQRSTAAWEGFGA
jgi:hypothetical protein